MERPLAVGYISRIYRIDPTQHHDHVVEFSIACFLRFCGRSLKSPTEGTNCHESHVPERTFVYITLLCPELGLFLAFGDFDGSLFRSQRNISILKCLLRSVGQFKEKNRNFAFRSPLLHFFNNLKLLSPPCKINIATIVKFICLH